MGQKRAGSTLMIQQCGRPCTNTLAQALAFPISQWGWGPYSDPGILVFTCCMVGHPKQEGVPRFTSLSCFLGEHLKDQMLFPKTVSMCSISDFWFKRFWLHPDREGGGEVYSPENFEEIFSWSYLVMYPCTVKLLLLCIWDSCWLPSKSAPSYWQQLKKTAELQSCAKQQSYFNTWHIKCYWLGNRGRWQHSVRLSVTGHLPTQEDDKRCVHIKGTWIEQK